MLPESITSALANVGRERSSMGNLQRHSRGLYNRGDYRKITGTGQWGRVRDFPVTTAWKLWSLNWVLVLTQGHRRQHFLSLLLRLNHNLMSSVLPGCNGHSYFERLWCSIMWSVSTSKSSLAIQLGFGSRRRTEYLDIQPSDLQFQVVCRG